MYIEKHIFPGTAQITLLKTGSEHGSTSVSGHTATTEHSSSLESVGHSRRKRTDSRSVQSLRSRGDYPRGTKCSSSNESKAETSRRQLSLTSVGCQSTEHSRKARNESSAHRARQSERSKSERDVKRSRRRSQTTRNRPRGGDSPARHSRSADIGTKVTGRKGELNFSRPTRPPQRSSEASKKRSSRDGSPTSKASADRRSSANVAENQPLSLSRASEESTCSRSSRLRSSDRSINHEPNDLRLGQTAACAQTNDHSVRSRSRSISSRRRSRSSKRSDDRTEQRSRSLSLSTGRSSSINSTHRTQVMYQYEFDESNSKPGSKESQESAWQRRMRRHSVSTSVGQDNIAYAREGTSCNGHSSHWNTSSSYISEATSQSASTSSFAFDRDDFRQSMTIATKNESLFLLMQRAGIRCTKDQVKKLEQWGVTIQNNFP